MSLERFDNNNLSNSLELIPDDVLKYLLEFLDLQSLSRVSRINKNFLKLCKEKIEIYALYSLYKFHMVQIVSACRNIFDDEDNIIYFLDNFGHVWFANEKQLPKIISGLPKIVQISIQAPHIFFLTENGKVWIKTFFCSINDKPTELTFPLKIKLIVSSKLATFFLDVDGNVYAVGSNTNGQLGLGPNIPKTADPKKIESLDPIQNIICTRTNTFLLGVNGTVWECGTRHDGPKKINVINPRPTKIPELIDIKEIAVTKAATFFLSTSGRVYVRGTFSDYQPYNETPTLFNELINIAKVKTCENKFVFITGEGNVIRLQSPKLVFTPIPDLTSIKNVTLLSDSDLPFIYVTNDEIGIYFCYPNGKVKPTLIPYLNNILSINSSLLAIDNSGNFIAYNYFGDDYKENIPQKMVSFLASSNFDFRKTHLQYVWNSYQHLLDKFINFAKNKNPSNKIYYETIMNALELYTPEERFFYILELENSPFKNPQQIANLLLSTFSENTPTISNTQTIILKCITDLYFYLLKKHNPNKSDQKQFLRQYNFFCLLTHIANNEIQSVDELKKFFETTKSFFVKHKFKLFSVEFDISSRTTTYHDLSMKLVKALTENKDNNNAFLILKKGCQIFIEAIDNFKCGDRHLVFVFKGFKSEMQSTAKLRLGEQKNC